MVCQSRYRNSAKSMTARMRAERDRLRSHLFCGVDAFPVIDPPPNHDFGVAKLLLMRLSHSPSEDLPLLEPSGVPAVRSVLPVEAMDVPPAISDLRCLSVPWLIGADRR
jgi:hypothetical protein